jgi:tetratricopeptide (TPR) repeat protein
MGSRLAILAAELIAATVMVGDAAADTRARELFKQGVEEYKAQKYDAAITTLTQSYSLDPRPDSLFALAQAERRGDRCDRAIIHYKKLLESTTDLPTAKAVQTNMALCPEAAPVEKPVAAAAATQPPPPPKVITKTVVREVRRGDVLATLLFAGGMLGVGAGGGLFLASRDAEADARRAATLDDHERFEDRAKLQRMTAYIAGGVGVAMMGVAVIRWATGGKTRTTEVAIVPSERGSMAFVSTRF